MKVTEFKYIETIRPNSSCGTGYSEPDKFLVKTDNGKERYIFVDIWYRTMDRIKEEFDSSFFRTFSNDPLWGNPVDNYEEAFQMYLNELHKPYGKKFEDNVKMFYGRFK